MNYLREIRILITKNVLLFILHIALVGALLFLVNTTIHFVRAHDDSIREVMFYEVFEGKELYTMADNLFGYEHLAFSAENPDITEMLASFYDTLHQQESFLFMSRMSTSISASTPIDIEQRRQRMNAFYMNENLFYFYDIQTQHEDQKIFWQDVDYSSGRIPILLGNNFAETYAVGDIFLAENFFLEQELEVVGFLAGSTTIYYEHNYEYSLDDYLIIPFPPNLLELLELGVDEGVVSTLVHVMLAADIIVDRTGGYSINGLIEMIGTIARRIGYEHYIFLGVPVRISQLASMVSLIYRTQTVITLMLILAIALTALVLIYLAKIYFERSVRTYLAYLHCGAEQKFILRLSAFDLAMPLVLSFIVSFYFLQSIYRIEWVPLWLYFIFAHHYVSIIILIFFFFISYYYVKRKVINL